MSAMEKEHAEDGKGELPLYKETAPGSTPKHSKYGRHKKFAGAAAALYLTGSALYYSPASHYAERLFHGRNHGWERHGHMGRPGAMGHGVPHRPFDKLEGPQYLPDQLVRSDISEDRNGVPLLLQIKVLDATTSAPIDNVSVDVWQADASGHYSGIRHRGRQGNRGGDRPHKGPFPGFAGERAGNREDRGRGEDNNDDDEPRGRSRGPSAKHGDRKSETAQSAAADVKKTVFDDNESSPARRGPCKQRQEHEKSPSGAMKEKKERKDKTDKRQKKPKNGEKERGSPPPPPPPPHGRPHGPPPPHGGLKGPHSPHGPPDGPPPHGPHGPHRPHHPPKDGKKHHKHNGTADTFEPGHVSAAQAEAETSWLRGVQQTSGDGIVLFSTIFPAPNHHRASHIHYKLHAPVEKTFEGRFHNMDTHVLATGQLFFDDSLVKEILKLAEYEKARGHITLSEDRVYNGQGLISDVTYVNAESIESGIKAKVTLTVDAADYVKHKDEEPLLVEIDGFTDSEAD